MHDLGQFILSVIVHVRVFVFFPADCCMSQRRTGEDQIIGHRYKIKQLRKLEQNKKKLRCSLEGVKKE